MYTTLSKEQEEKLLKWYKRLPKKLKNKPLKLKFTTDGIGIIIKAKVGDRKMDLSEYENF